MFVHVPGRRRTSTAWAAPTLVLLSMLAFVWLATLDPDPRTLFLRRWGAVPESLFASGGALSSLLDGRWLRLFSAQFIHADWLHLVGNMLFLVMFGLPAERALGAARFLLLFLVGGALANLAPVLLLQSPSAVVIGASGSISALIGAYLALFPRAYLSFVVPLGLFLEFVRTPASLMIGVWALLQLGFTFIGPGFGAVAWSAHVAGFLIGVVLGLAFRPAVARRLRER